jgi:hypothetical protein
MISILSLGRRRFAGLLAWLALASLGVVGVPHDSAAFDGHAQKPVVGALQSGSGPILRSAAVKIGAACRNGDDDRGASGGLGPAGLPPAIMIAAPVTAAAVYEPAAACGGALTRRRPYAARAPPARPV